MNAAEQQDIRSLAAYFTGLGSRVIWDGDRVRSIAIFGQDVQDKHLTDLRGFTGLTELNLTRSHVTDAGMFYIGKLRELESLLLGGTAITDEGFEQLDRLSQLKSLNLIGTAVTDKGLQYFKDATDLEALWLERTDITDDGVALLPSFSKLEFLDLTNTLITDSGLAVVGQLTTLEELCISACLDLTPAGFEYLANLTQLTGFWADSCTLTPDSLRHLASLPLRILSLNWTAITDEGLAVLSDISSLEKLDLLGTDISDAAVAEFRAHHPNCELHYSPVHST